MYDFVWEGTGRLVGLGGDAVGRCVTCCKVTRGASMGLGRWGGSGGLAEGGR